MAVLPHSYFRFLSIRDEAAWEKLRLTLCEQQLFTSTVANFNDPFEASPIVVGDTNEAITINYRTASTNWSQLVTPLFGAIDGQARTVSSFLDYFRRSLSLVSFSRRINSGLLWGHYANGYRGVALHFSPTNDTASPFNQQNFHWVNYEKQRPYISFESLRTYLDSTVPHPAGAFAPSARGATELQIMSSLLTWKSEDWNYEQEARLITAATTSQVAFPKNELISIILGPLAVADDEQRIRDLLASSNSATKIARARLSRTDYSIEIEW